MKKLIGSLMVVLALVCFTSLPAKSEGTSEDSKILPAEATCAASVIGTVMSIDKAKNQIVVKDQYDKVSKTIVVKPSEIAKLKVGNVVRFVLPASNVANSIEMLKPSERAKGNK